VEEVELNCVYGHDFDKESCEIEKSNLSMRTVGDSFTFSGSKEDKEKTARIVFSKSGRVDHLPLIIFDMFPKLTALSVLSSDIPIVRKRLFKPEFAKIQVLWLNQDKIKMIKEKAFTHLTNMVEISLQQNKIQSLNRRVFENNHKLMRISLWDNQIKMIAPGTFQHLNQLKLVDLVGNECVNEFIECIGCGKINGTKLQRELQPCYEKYTRSFQLLNKGKITKFID
jgi:hypothetical protein